MLQLRLLALVAEEAVVIRPREKVAIRAPVRLAELLVTQFEDLALIEYI
jgi:hypothetical protein